MYKINMYLRYVNINTHKNWNGHPKSVVRVRIGVHFMVPDQSTVVVTV